MREDNHIKKIKRLIAEGRIRCDAGTVSQVDVKHDLWCGIFKGKRCHCDPDIKLSWKLDAFASN